ncbi:MAG: hypothetical protein VYA57_04815 [Candidatus Thermoplasmatota archaeon]|nr:hypothetical protein [Candidatus Thermoplasmatota archaeon]
MAGAGYPINWAASTGNRVLMQNPLYVKYSNSTFANIVAADVKADLNGVLATAESAEICAYLSWLLRTLALLA